MENGKQGDHPIADLVIYGQHPFPPDIEALMRELLALHPAFPDDTRPFSEQRVWEQQLRDWANGKDLETGREALRAEISRYSRAGGSN